MQERSLGSNMEQLENTKLFGRHTLAILFNGSNHFLQLSKGEGDSTGKASKVNRGTAAATAAATAETAAAATKVDLVMQGQGENQNQIDAALSTARWGNKVDVDDASGNLLSPDRPGERSPIVNRALISPSKGRFALFTMELQREVLRLNDWVVEFTEGPRGGKKRWVYTDSAGTGFSSLANACAAQEAEGWADAQVGSSSEDGSGDDSSEDGSEDASDGGMDDASDVPSPPSIRSGCALHGTRGYCKCWWESGCQEHNGRLKDKKQDKERPTNTPDFCEIHCCGFTAISDVGHSRCWVCLMMNSNSRKKKVSKPDMKWYLECAAGKPGLAAAEQRVAQIVMLQDSNCNSNVRDAEFIVPLSRKFRVEGFQFKAGSKQATLKVDAISADITAGTSKRKLVLTLKELVRFDREAIITGILRLLVERAWLKLEGHRLRNIKLQLVIYKLGKEQYRQGYTSYGGRNFSIENEGLLAFAKSYERLGIVVCSVGDLVSGDNASALRSDDRNYREPRSKGKGLLKAMGLL